MMAAEQLGQLVKRMGSQTTTTALVITSWTVRCMLTPSRRTGPGAAPTPQLDGSAVAVWLPWPVGPPVASASPLTGKLDDLRRLEVAGAGAVELNVYVIAAHFGLDGHEIELACVDLVRAARQALGVPLAVKIGPFYSAMANMALRLVEAGADGLVLFNRFYQPDIDVERLEVAPTLALSTPEELRLRWIGILYRQLPASLAATGGVHSGQDVVKALPAGADVAMLASALLRHGPGHLSRVETGLRAWMQGHHYESVDQVRGRLSRAGTRDAAAYERANYVSLLSAATHGNTPRFTMGTCEPSRPARPVSDAYRSGVGRRTIVPVSSEMAQGGSRAGGGHGHGRRSRRDEDPGEDQVPASAITVRSWRKPPPAG
jgi:hypothetical protein